MQIKPEPRADYPVIRPEELPDFDGEPILQVRAFLPIGHVAGLPLARYATSAAPTHSQFLSTVGNH